MNTILMNNAGTQVRAARIAAAPGFQNFVTAGARTLREAIQAAVQGMNDGSLKPLAGSAARPYAQARAMLVLLADCYARHIYSSTKVASLARQEPDFLCWEELPDAHALRRFRVENRGVIHRCLMAALRFLVEQRILSGALTKVDGPQLVEEASRRIIMAAFADSTELDGE